MKSPKLEVKGGAVVVTLEIDSSAAARLGASVWNFGPTLLPVVVQFRGPRKSGRPRALAVDDAVCVLPLDRAVRWSDWRAALPNVKDSSFRRYAKAAIAAGLVAKQADGLYRRTRAPMDSFLPSRRPGGVQTPPLRGGLKPQPTCPLHEVGEEGSQ